MSEIALIILLLVMVFSPRRGWGGRLFGKGSTREKMIEHIVKTMREQNIAFSELESAMHAPDTEIKEGAGDMARTIFSWLGGLFIFAGLSVYIGMFWNSMGSALHIALTLGVGFVLFIIFISALKENKFPRLIVPLCVLQAFMQTGGWLVTIHEIFPQGDDPRKALLVVSGIMTIQQALVLWRYRFVALAIITLISTYSFLEVGLDLAGMDTNLISLTLGASLVIVTHILRKSALDSLETFGFLIGACWFNAGMYDTIATHMDVNWAGILTGISGMLFAYGLQLEGRQKRLADFGYIIGSILTYEGYFELVRHTQAELTFLGLAAFILYISTRVKSRMLLATSAFAILGFIGYYTEEYFVNSVGWPVALVIMGSAFLAVGSLAFRVKKRM